MPGLSFELLVFPTSTSTFESLLFLVLQSISESRAKHQSKTSGEGGEVCLSCVNVRGPIAKLDLREGQVDSGAEETDRLQTSNCVVPHTFRRGLG